MAFQCASCYRKKQEFTWRMLSKGKCENCGYKDVCVDAPFDIDPNWKLNVTADLKKAGLTIPESLLV